MGLAGCRADIAGPGVHWRLFSEAETSRLQWNRGGKVCRIPARGDKDTSDVRSIAGWPQTGLHRGG